MYTHVVFLNHAHIYVTLNHYIHNQPGDVAPEFNDGRRGIKTDVYMYGIVSTL